MARQVSVAEYVSAVTITDPVSGGDVTVEIYRDPVSGALVGIDASFEEDVRYGGKTGNIAVNSPYNDGHVLIVGITDPS